MTKQEILDHFKDIDFVYNDSSKHDTLSRMIDELLKEQEDLGTELTNAVELIHKKNERIEKLLKEQAEETEFDYDEHTMPTCVKCGFHPFCGYIPTIKWMEERGYKKCPSCGRTIKWN